MREGLALLLVNMLASEFCYKIEWLTSPGEKDTAIFRLINADNDAQEFSGSDKFEQAVEWLRQKA